MPRSYSARPDPENRPAQAQSAQEGSAPPGKNPPRRPEQKDVRKSQHPDQTPITEDQEDDGGESLLSGQSRETGGERDTED